MLSNIRMARLAAIVAFIGTAVAVFLHVFFATHAGALWRDEVNSLEVATMSSFAEMWAGLSFDSFPVLFFALLRGFAGVPAASSDMQLRILGATIGVLIVAAMWLNARWLRFGFPLISLALVGLNPMVIRYGDSLRAYGLGILLLLFCLGAIWRLVETFTPARTGLALVAAILSVQCLYYNAFLLFAICCGACAVTFFRRRNLAHTATILGIGAAAAASLLIYLPTIGRVGTTNFMWKSHFTAEMLWQKLSETLGSPNAIGVWIWLALFLGGIVFGSWMLMRPSPNDEANPGKDRLLFAFVTLLVGTAAYIGFLFYLSYQTQPWYYVAFAAFVATCLEAIFAAARSPAKAFLFRGGFALLFIGMSSYPAALELRPRQSNIDYIAAELKLRAQKDDLILINTWNYGVSFRRYYHEAIPWTTVPPIDDLRVQRCDLAKRQMMSPAPLAGMLQQIADTLRRGNDVWLIGSIDYVPRGQKPLVVPPGYEGPDGWVGAGFYSAWSEQTSYFLQTHITHFEHIVVPVPEGAVKFESLPLSRFRGFRDGVENAAL